MLKKIAIAVLVLIVAVLLYATTKPNTFRIERSIVMNTTPDKPFALVNDFHQWPSWSPFEHLDPNMKRTITGPDSGVGASYAWEGNSNAGAGSMIITESTPPSKVLIDLTFLKPFESKTVTEFTFVPEGAGTKVTWAMSGPSNYMSKLMSVFMNMDKMVGPDFEKGLATMKSVAEKQP